jgi:hypothetical protein
MAPTVIKPFSTSMEPKYITNPKAPFMETVEKKVKPPAHLACSLPS